MALGVLCAYTAVYISRLHELFGFLADMRIVRVLGILSLVLAVTAASPSRRSELLAFRETILLASLILIASVGVPFSVWPGGSQEFLVDIYGKLALFFVSIVLLATSVARIQSLVLALLAGVGMLGAFTIQGSSVLNVVGGRAFAGSTYDPNDVALMMTSSLPFALGGALWLKGSKRWLCVTVAVICVLATVKTQSRAGFLGLLVVAALSQAVLMGRAMTGRFIVAGLVAGLVVAAAPQQYWGVIATIFGDSDGPIVEFDGGEYLRAGLTPRLELWKKAAEIFLANPVTGVGIGMYEVAEGLTHEGVGKWTTAHNSFLQVAAELGIGGLFVYTLLIGRTWRSAQLTVAQRGAGEWLGRATGVALVGFVVVGFSLSQGYAPLLYFLFAIGTALRAIAQGKAIVPEARPDSVGSG